MEAAVTEISSRRRTTEIRVKLAPSMAEQFDLVAANRGMLPASLAALVLGEYLENLQEKRRLNTLTVAAMSKEIVNAFTPEKLVATVKLVMADPDLLEKIKAHIPTDAESGQAGRPESSAGPEAAAHLPEDGAAGSVR